MITSAPRAILFDLDDTILAYEAVAEAVWRTVCQRFAGRLNGRRPEELLEAVQAYRRWYWSDPDRHRRARLNPIIARSEVVAGAFARLGLDSPELATEIGETYTVERDKEVRPFPGALDTLHELGTRGIRLALVTNGATESQRGKVERFDLGPLFDTIVIEGEFGTGKPDERVYLHALEQMGCRAEEAWMVGDNLEWEVAAPQRLGLVGILVDSAGTGLPASSTVRPDRIVNALPELLTPPL